MPLKKTKKKKRKFKKKSKNKKIVSMIGKKIVYNNLEFHNFFGYFLCLYNGISTFVGNLLLKPHK